MIQYKQSNYQVIPWRNKGKESCSNWLFNTGFFIFKEGPDDVSNFTKSFAHILNYEFYRLYYIVKIVLAKYSINAWLLFTNNSLHRISWSTHFYKPIHQTSILLDEHSERYFRQIYLIRELSRFLQPGLISMNFWKKLGISNVNHERMHKLIMDLTPNDWKHIATLNWNFSKTPLKKFMLQQ